MLKNRIKVKRNYRTLEVKLAEVVEKKVVDNVAKNIAIKVWSIALDNIMRQDLVYKGDLMTSLKVEKIEDGHYRVYSDLIYAPFIEHGRGYRGDGAFPAQTRINVYAIKEWAKFRFKVDDKEAWKIAGKISRVLTTEGMYAHPFLLPALKTVEMLLADGDYKKQMLNAYEV